MIVGVPNEDNQYRVALTPEGALFLTDQAAGVIHASGWMRVPARIRGGSA
jgi:hypothetical protein